MINNILINTVVPVLFVYGHYHDEKKYKKRALDWLENIKAETNSIITGFNYISITSKSAYDSQALLELKREYCDRKKCLDCAVGNAILKA